MDALNEDTIEGKQAKKNGNPEVYPSMPQESGNAANMSPEMKAFYANMAKMKLYDIIDVFQTSTIDNATWTHWQTFLKDMFVVDAFLIIVSKVTPVPKRYNLLSYLLSILCSTIQKHGVIKISIIVYGLITETLNSNSIYFNCPGCRLKLLYADGSYMRYFSHFNGTLDFQFKITWVNIAISNFKLGLEWGALENLLHKKNNSNELLKKLENPEVAQLDGQDSKNSMLVNRDALLFLKSRFDAFQNISSLGIDNNIVRSIQLNEVMSNLKYLKMFQRENNIVSPVEAMQKFVQKYRQKENTEHNNNNER
ncbi:LIM domain-binding protein KNAG_0F00960 [Huiozyma naganishii CBS 8797]|uniref:Uncharacterized protein n=1 Tax=Huiozyma naganishii (strain ATCC MYA-139 / BCRC 22969 / CBS 8797 / KCTC 17520 / NBRC 10181 / NCYC 3082 / Yp74L-3) TaxID=1071383 RepID=J7R7C2_HUIN7|nr:hypothetical protein KNAG_0F00960 [Kazachstania naganishii CBS 8797]CCK70765.1 hypothetical protein KNAG_0F00960 [Kazachstania naganishii CBS 8797]